MAHLTASLLSASIESVNGPNQTDIDDKLTQIYSYYCNGGLYHILLKEVSKLLVLSFTYLITLALCVLPWTSVLACTSAADCRSIEEYLRQGYAAMATASPTLLLYAATILIVIFCIQLYASISTLMNGFAMYRFYHRSLRVSMDLFEGSSWGQIVDRVVYFQSEANILQMTSVVHISEREIASRIQRRDNYMYDYATDS
jgi:Autophagy protein ATG9